MVRGKRKAQPPFTLHPSVPGGNELHLNTVLAMAQTTPRAPGRAAPREIVTCSTNLLLAQFFEDNTPQTLSHQLKPFQATVPRPTIAQLRDELQQLLPCVPAATKLHSDLLHTQSTQDVGCH